MDDSDNESMDSAERELQDYLDDLRTIYDMDDTEDIHPMHNTSHNPLQVPGFGIVPFKYELHYSRRFAHGFNDWRQIPCPTARELAMTAIMNVLTEKENWRVDIFNDEVIGEWRGEVSSMKLFSEKSWDWCLAELRDKAHLFEDTKCVRVLDTGSCIMKSDARVPLELGTELRDYTALLYSEMKSEKRPNQQVQLNLVDPSLYPLVYGRTCVLSNGEKLDLDTCLDFYESGTPAPLYAKNAPPPNVLQGIHEGKERPFAAGRISYGDIGMLRWSSRFQWLPCEVEFTGDEGTDVAITSYINNLSPVHHKPLYGIIEKLISLAIEPWNRSLIKGRSGPVPIRLRTYDAEYNSDQVRLEPGEKLKESDPQHPEPGTAFSYEDWKDGRNGKVVMNMDDYYLIKYSVPLDYKHDMYEINLQDTFRKEGLQVIVKMSSIELTPSQPSSPVGDWTIDGMLNEHIVATSIYLYDESNVTDAKITFRQEVWTQPKCYGCYSEDNNAFAEVFGLDARQYEDGPSMQELGSVPMRKGRLLTWPNTMQHRIEPFELTNKSEPGHRRFIMLHLVDPHYRICSTRNVPPQRHDWWIKSALESAGLAAHGVPPELNDMITGYTEEWPIGKDEAERNKVDMMEEHRWVNRAIEERAWRIHACQCMGGGGE
ncbi:hypothetical protein VE03_02361 [Pseudogymnoascus sp. 23342-1-I1]|nr:hypothetical protein VE03_02361 [Pseudogymnoascus sp. 23342-1-I1]